MNIFKSLESHKDLAAGWYQGKGGPLSERVIETAKVVCEGLISAGVEVDDLEDFPFSDGRLEIACYTPDEKCLSLFD